MNRPARLPLLALIATIVAMGMPAETANLVAWPRVERDMRPWTRWWWLGSAVDKAGLTAELERYRRAGLGGVEITPIYGVRGEESLYHRFLSEGWLGAYRHTLWEAERLGLGVDLALASGWPFGGPWVTAEDACKNVTFKTYTVPGGARLAEPVRLQQQVLVRAQGRRPSISTFRRPVAATPDLQALAPEQIRFDQPLVLRSLMGYRGEEVTEDLASRVGPDGLLDWTPPAGGQWLLVAAFEGQHGKLVERAGPGGEGDVIDHFSRAALAHHLEPFAPAVAPRVGRGLRAVFNDSYEVDDASGNANWTPSFLDHFRRLRNYDLRRHLPALMGIGDPDEQSRVSCDYRETLSDLLLTEFTQPWREWAGAHNTQVRNQAHGSPANILDLYAASDIPETEGTDLLRMKFASSAAHVSGRRLTAAEAATWMDEHFLETLGAAKAAADLYFLGGVNHICYHGTPYTPARAAWPGHLFYASVHFGTSNSFWPDFPALNAYVTRCQSFLQAGTPDEDLLVYYPIHDAWSGKPSLLLPHFAGPEGTSAKAAGETLLGAGIGFDYVSDRQLEGLQCRDGRILGAASSYRAILVPACRRMPPGSLRRILELVDAGATVVFQGGVPTEVPGFDRLAARRAEAAALRNRLMFRAGGGEGHQRAMLGSGMISVGDDVVAQLAALGIVGEPLVREGMSFVRRRSGAGWVYFLRNRRSSPVDGWVTLSRSGGGAALFDPLTGALGVGRVRRVEQGSQVYLQLQPGETRIVRITDQPTRGTAFPIERPGGAGQRLDGPWQVRFDAGGPVLPAPTTITGLASWTEFGGAEAGRFSGSATYSTEFARPRGGGDALWLDLGRVAESAQVRLNGRDLGTVITPPYRLRIARNLFRDHNRLAVTVSNLMANRVADMDRRGVVYRRFYNINFPARRRENSGPDGLFTAAGWKPLESGLLGPVRLIPTEPQLGQLDLG